MLPSELSHTERDLCKNTDNDWEIFSEKIIQSI